MIAAHAVRAARREARAPPGVACGAARARRVGSSERVRWTATPAPRSSALSASSRAKYAPGVGAIRLRLVAHKGAAGDTTLKDGNGRYLPHVLLDLDYWALIPR